MKDVQFMSAKEKVNVLRKWKIFLKNGLKREDFTRSLYQHLINHCSFIAHYDESGFYETYFSRPEDTALFFRQFDLYHFFQSVEYGGNHWLLADDYHDINHAMCEAFKPYRKSIYSRCAIDVRGRDLEQAKLLLEKHNVLSPV